MYYYIYKITNRLNGKFYIGKRISQYPIDFSYWGSGLNIKNAVAKYGHQNFTRQILDYAMDHNELIEKEISYIAQYLNDPKCYNIRRGGKGGFSPEEASRGAKTKNALYGGWAYDKKTKSSFAKSRELAAECGKKGRVPIGYTHAPETKKKIAASLSLSIKGVPKPKFLYEISTPFGIVWTTNLTTFFKTWGFGRIERKRLDKRKGYCILQRIRL